MDLRDIHEHVLSASFPPEELDDVETFVDDVLGGDAKVIVHRDGDRTVGVAVLYSFPGADLLGYIAVLREYRSQNVGAALLARAVESVSGSGKPLLAEIERPDRHDYHPEYGDPKRRIDFYAEHGATVLDLPFFQPPVAGSDRRRLGVLLVRLDAAESGWMDAEPVRRFVLAYVGEADENDDYSIALHAALKVPTIALLPIEDYADLLTP